MEPAETPLERFRIYSTVTAVREIKYQNWLSGAGPDAVFEEVSKGWFVFLKGSWEGLHVGKTPPALQPGDKILITIRKLPNA